LKARRAPQVPPVRKALRAFRGRPAVRARAGRPVPPVRKAMLDCKDPRVAKGYAASRERPARRDRKASQVPRAKPVLPDLQGRPVLRDLPDLRRRPAGSVTSKLQGMSSRAMPGKFWCRQSARKALRPFREPGPNAARRPVWLDFACENSGLELRAVAC
jgi:hypothetical protein